MTDNVYWLLKVKVHEGKLDDFRALATEMIKGTREEEGCLNYEWFFGEDGRTVHVYERYRDNAAALQHIENFASHFAERFQHLMELEGVNVYGANDAVKDAVASFQPAYFEKFDGFSR